MHSDTKHTIFPHIFFEFGNCSKFKQLPHYFNFLLNKLYFCFENYSREETIQGWKLYEEIWYWNLFEITCLGSGHFLSENNLSKFYRFVISNPMISSPSSRVGVRYLSDLKVGVVPGCHTNEILSDGC